MKISTNITYLLPFIMLSLTMFCMIAYWSSSSNEIESQVVLAIGVAGALYMVLRQLIKLVKGKYLKIIICILPLVIDNILKAKNGGTFHLQLAYPIIFGCLLYTSFILFDDRYMVTLSDTSIQYTSLLGLSGEIPLQSITKLEQKKNMLSFFIKEFKLLDLAKKTCIAFCDENMDEYEINFYSTIFRGNRVFDTIITRANELGNLKIRQYQV
jgi:hypothetical protein